MNTQPAYWMETTFFCVGEYPSFQKKIDPYISGLTKNYFPSSMQGEYSWIKNMIPYPGLSR